MVYKTERHGVRTGNSFRGWKSITKHLRLYRTHSYLIRSHITGNLNLDISDLVQFEKTSAFGEGDSIRDGVEYSLNKQGRWDLPDVLENIILSQDKPQDFDIQMIERHRLSRMANCVRVCSTGGVFHGGGLSEDRKFKIKTSAGYFQSNSVLNAKSERSARARRNRRRRRGDAQNNPVENNEEQPKEANKLRYEVHVPGPVTNYLTHKSKTIGIDTYDLFRWNGYQDKNKRKTRRNKLNSDIKELLSCMDDPLDDSEEESSVQDSDDTTEGQVTIDVMLHEILQHTNSAKKLTDSKRRRPSGGSISSVNSEENPAKTHIVYVENPEKPMSETETVFIPVKLHRTVLEPVHVIMKEDAVLPQTLSERFGKKYIECECFPRKFIINISDDVSKIKMISVEATSALRTEACIVFTHDTENEINTATEYVYRVFLNANFGDSLNSIKIETIFDYMETNLEELIDRTLFFIETLPSDSVVCDSLQQTGKKNKGTAVEECAKWSSSSYRPSNSYLLEHFIATAPETHEAISMGYDFVSAFDAFTNDPSENVASQKDKFCCICFLPLDVHHPGTALISCSHWFCDSCWQEYLETKTSSGARDFLCPEFDCDKTVDPGTVLSLVNMRYIIRHARRCHDTEVEQRTTTRWCPNEKCDRVLERSCDDVKTSRCVCGVEVCFDCLGTPHWPASCDSSKSYYKKLRQSGDIGIEPLDTKTLVVNGKPCPQCHRFLTKNGGCPSMICLCGANFCWGCGQLWASRTHGTDCYKHGYKDNHNTTERKFPPHNPLERKNLQSWYRMALKHRVNRHPRRLSSMRASVKALSKRLRIYIIQCENSGVAISLDFDNELVSYKSEADKASAFLTNTVELYAEINHVVENTAVLINSDELPVKSRTVLQHISRRLSSFADIIYKLLVHNGTFGNEFIIQKLKDARFHCRRTLQSLIRCVKSVNVGN